MAKNQKFKCILLTKNSGINKVQEVFENSKSALDVVDFYNNYFINREKFNTLIDEVKSRIPNVVEIRCFGTVGYAVPRAEYYDSLANTIKILGENEVFGKFKLTEVDFNDNNASEKYKFLVQNTFEYDKMMYDIMLNQIVSYNRDLENATPQESEDN